MATAVLSNSPEPVLVDKNNNESEPKSQWNGKHDPEQDAKYDSGKKIRSNKDVSADAEIKEPDDDAAFYCGVSEPEEAPPATKPKSPVVADPAPAGCDVCHGPDKIQENKEKKPQVNPKDEEEPSCKCKSAQEKESASPSVSKKNKRKAEDHDLAAVADVSPAPEKAEKEQNNDS